MYWFTNIYNTLTTSLYIGIVGVLSSCDSSNHTANNEQQQTYFDIPAFFEKQISSLEKSNPEVSKTVVVNGQIEQKNTQIKNWNTELSTFLEIDLNKPSYQSYVVKDSSNNIVSYTINNKDLDIKAVKVSYKKNTPTSIEIDKLTKNMLYETNEKLVYVIDSMYSIQKKQKVTLLSPNDYKITGLIK